MSKRSVSLPTFVCVLLIVAMAASTLTLLLAGARTAAPEAGEGPLSRAEEIFALVESQYYQEVTQKRWKRRPSTACSPRWAIPTPSTTQTKPTRP